MTGPYTEDDLFAAVESMAKLAGWTLTRVSVTQAAGTPHAVTWPEFHLRPDDAPSTVDGDAV